MSYTNIVIKKVYEFLVSNKPKELDIQFKNDLFLDEQISAEESTELNTTPHSDNLVLISLDEQTPPVEDAIQNGIVKKDFYNTIYYSHDFITPEKYVRNHKHVVFKLDIKTEDTNSKQNMNIILDHYYDLIFKEHRNKIPLTLDNGKIRYIYLSKEPEILKVKSNKNDIQEYELKFPCFYSI